MKLPYSLVLVGLSAACSVAVYAASPAVTNAVRSRQANFKEIGGAFKSINDELKTGAPDINTVRPLARDLANRTALLPRLFPKGSGVESGLRTRAKAEIWRDGATFARLQGDMITAARALDAAAASGNIADLNVARARLGSTCKSCHDDFRESS